MPSVAANLSVTRVPKQKALLCIRHVLSRLDADNVREWHCHLRRAWHAESVNRLLPVLNRSDSRDKPCLRFHDLLDASAVYA
jgi:hypothetical protein